MKKRFFYFLRWLARKPVCFFHNYGDSFNAIPDNYGDLNTMETLIPLMEPVSAVPLNKRT